MGKIFQAMEKSRQGRYQDIPPDNHESFPEAVLEVPDEQQAPLLDFVRQTSLPDEPLSQVLSAPETPVPDTLDPSLVAALRPNAMEAEQFRLLKNNILFPEKGNPPRSIMITSPSPDEGKSFISANLAVSIAKSIDEYVLLMDCDLRGPSIHALFGLDQSPGLSEHLSGGVPLSMLLKKTFLDKLTVLPGGSVPGNPSELLSSEQMRRLLTEVKARYSDRYVIIDTPPPYITSETNAIARVVDGIILVIRQGRTRIKEVQDIVDIYGRQKILGVIKNFATVSPGTGHRYRKYGYRKR